MEELDAIEEIESSHVSSNSLAVTLVNYNVNKGQSDDTKEDSGNHLALVKADAYSSDEP